MLAPEVALSARAFMQEHDHFYDDTMTLALPFARYASDISSLTAVATRQRHACGAALSVPTRHTRCAIRAFFTPLYMKARRHHIRCHALIVVARYLRAITRHSCIC